MHDEQLPTWQERLANLRANPPQSPGSALLQTSLNSQESGFTDISQEALMTIIAIMKDNDDPKLQMAAAKMLLDKQVAVPVVNTRIENTPPTADDVDAAIALAKAVLDELAVRKTQKLDGAGGMGFESARGTDNPAG